MQLTSTKRKFLAQGSDTISLSSTKKEAAEDIVGGCRHVHASSLGKKDELYRTTLQLLGPRRKPRIVYSWEPRFPQFGSTLRSSKARTAAIAELNENLKPVASESLRERVSMVFEELFTNCLYHAYGDPSIDRKQPIECKLDTPITFQYHYDDEGVYFSITDLGGTFTFEEIQSAFQRCYLKKPEIEQKPSGAGLGLYFVFETVTHLKVEVWPDRKTVVSGWISRRRTSKDFSFNYFVRETP